MSCQKKENTSGCRQALEQPLIIYMIGMILRHSWDFCFRKINCVVCWINTHRNICLTYYHFMLFVLKEEIKWKILCICTAHRHLTRFYSSIPLCSDLYTLVVLRYYAVIGISAAVYISCHVVLHAVINPCVVFCACFIFYNNILIK